MNSFNSKFAEYVKRKLSPNKCQSIFKGSFLGDSPVQSNLNSSSSSKLSVSSQFDSSAYQSSKYTESDRSNSPRIQKSFTKKRGLQKLQQLQDNVCAICLDQIKDRCQLTCKHKFCFGCLEEWFSNSNRCPYCRAETASFWYKGEEYKVEARQFQYQQDENDSSGMDWVCYNCEETQQGDIVLICDRCEANACHIRCDETLRGVEPLGQWICHFCRN